MSNGAIQQPTVRHLSSINLRRFEIVFPENPEWMTEEAKAELHKQLDVYFERYKEQTV